MSDTRNPVEILKVARERLTQGWTQSGFYHDEQSGGCCAVGALAYAVSDGKTHQPCNLNGLFDDSGPYHDMVVAEIKLAEAVEKATGGRETSVITFNDNASSLDEVLAVFDEAIKQEDQPTLVGANGGTYL